ncbi:hypothetical protein GCM10008957_49600 [Deinococcus ruber]|uniref:Uncharacterized protein n=1 Tax=Deinococcus ruber TaxID=1848197 RepID=A0A918CPE6_9DEIO|nr:hypothetical protein GCM10008957_49600 [Deinococcus ruber]
MLDSRKQPLHDPVTGAQQTVGMAALGNSSARFPSCGEHITLKNGDVFEVICQYPCSEKARHT